MVLFSHEAINTPRDLGVMSSSSILVNDLLSLSLKDSTFSGVPSCRDFA